MPAPALRTVRAPLAPLAPQEARASEDPEEIEVNPALWVLLVQWGTLAFRVLRGLPVLRGPADAPSEALRGLRERQDRRVTPVLQGCRVFPALQGLQDVTGLQDCGVCRVRMVLRDEWDHQEP